MRTVYVNGEYVAENEARVSIFDRGFLFADGVYEVTSVLDGKFVDFEGHLNRLVRSLKELRIEASVTHDSILEMHRQLVDRNNLHNGLIYLQVTRGAADRDFGFPEDTACTVVAFTQEKEVRNPDMARTGVKVVTVPELRWERRDIKSVALLAQVLSKQAAREKGAFEGWMVEDGKITEGTSSTAFIVKEDGKLVTRPLSNAVLPGITRMAVLDLLSETDLELDERTFTPEEAYEAAEAFLTSASSFVAPVVEIDGHRIGGGQPGPMARRLRELYLARADAG